MRRAAVAAVLSILVAPIAAHPSDSGRAGIVEAVVPGSPAEMAGMQSGDRLVAIDGKSIATQEDLREVLDRYHPGDTVPVTVERGGEQLDLTMTFGERPGGGVSIGVRINLFMRQGAVGAGDKGAAECLDWIEKTYRIEAMTESLDLDLAEDYAAARECVERDISAMGGFEAVKFCDNVFKVHCSGTDLLTEVGEAQVEKCSAWLVESLGVQTGRQKSWTTCAEQKIFDRYVTKGEASDEGACRAVLLDECGSSLDALIRDGSLTSGQREFTECCRADRFENDRNSAGSCPMIGEQFTRGPCHDYPVCLNRVNGEWIHCGAAG